MTEQEELGKGEQQTETEVNWEQADILSSKFVRFEKDVEKKVFVKNWRLISKMDKFSDTEKVFLEADVMQEDGNEVNKIISSSSPRLRSALRKVLESADKNTGVLVGVTKVGEGVDTQYAAKAL